MNLLILSPMQTEIDYLLKYYKPQAIIQKKSFRLYNLCMGKSKIYFGITGVGGKNIRTFFEKVKPETLETDLIISTGFAGAVNPKLKVGDIVIANRISGDASPEIPVPDGLSSIQPVKNNFHVGNCFTSGDILNKQDKYKLGLSGRNIDFVDMESLEISSCCRKLKLSCIIIRAVSDRLSFNFPDKEFIQDSWKRIIRKRLLLKMIKNPVNLIRTFILIRNLAKTKKSLFINLKDIIELKTGESDGNNR